MGFLLHVDQGEVHSPVLEQHEEHWPKMVPPTSTVWKASGSRALVQCYGSSLTLLEPTARDSKEEDAFQALLKQGTAALLNSFARKGFPYRAREVKSPVRGHTV